MRRAVGRRGMRGQPGLSVSPAAEASHPVPGACGLHVPGLKERLDAALQTLALARTPASHRTGMDITWLTDRIGIGGGIWNPSNMIRVARAGVTHIIDMQIEFDDTPLAAEHGIEVLWNPTDDDFEAKPPELFQRGVEFAQAALRKPETKLFIHCAAGIHRAPMMAAALLGAMGWTLYDAMQLIESRRPTADFVDVYVHSVERFLDGQSRPRFSDL
jgi:protein-tyrosine phosphatase